MTRIAASLHHRDAHPRLAQPLDRDFRQRRAQASTLVVGIDCDHRDLPDVTLRTQDRGDKPGHLALHLGDPDAGRVIAENLTNRGRLPLTPVASQPRR